MREECVQHPPGFRTGARSQSVSNSAQSGPHKFLSSEEPDKYTPDQPLAQRPPTTSPSSPHHPRCHPFHHIRQPCLSWASSNVQPSLSGSTPLATSSPRRPPPTSLVAPITSLHFTATRDSSRGRLRRLVLLGSVPLNPPATHGRHTPQPRPLSPASQRAPSTLPHKPATL